MGRATYPKPRPIHPWPLRLMHWVNAFAIVMLIGSGWQIYNASPLFNFTFPETITIGAWLGAGIAWHLAFIWLLMLNGLSYLLWGFLSGHFKQKLWPITPRAVLHDIGAALRFKLPHQSGVYNAVQRVLYLGVIFAGITIVISGLSIWKPVQLRFLPIYAAASTLPATCILPLWPASWRFFHPCRAGADGAARAAADDNRR